MYKPILPLLAILACTLCHAQTTVTGILQTADNRPVDYANIVLLAQADSTFLTGTVCNEDGRFTLVLPGQKENVYLIRVTNIGYKTICQPVQPGNIGILQMEEDAQMLGEVVVKGDLPVTRLKGDAMITNIEGSVLAKTGTVQDMLNYIPGVASQKGDLQVLGRGAPVVYINGRLMRDASELEQLSSEDIQSVEVVNNPGARYDASVKAVIRIWTKKPTGEGFGLSNRIYINHNKKWNVLEQINLNYRKGGLDLFGMLYLYRGYWWDKMKIVQDAYLDEHWRQTLKGDANRTDKNLTTDFGMNYVFDVNHSIGFKYRYDRYPSIKGSAVYDANIMKNNLHFEETRSINKSDAQSVGHSLNMYYSGKINKWNIDFNTDLLWRNENESDAVVEKTMQSTQVTERPVNASTETYSRLYAGKLIFSHPLLGGELAFGGDYSYTNRDMGYCNLQGILNDDESKIEE